MLTLPPPFPFLQDKNTVEDGNLFFGVLFYSILYMLLGAISEMHLLVARLP